MYFFICDKIEVSVLFFGNQLLNLNISNYILFQVNLGFSYNICFD